MIGTVYAITGNNITISPEAGASCFGCMHQTCQANQQLVTAKNPLSFALSIGQRVEIEASKAVLASQSLTALLPLVLGFIGGFLLVGILFPGAGESAQAVGGVFALFAAAGITYNICKRFPSKTCPHVVRVL
jgi:positive regulator of sigma E activity